MFNFELLFIIFSHFGVNVLLPLLFRFPFSFCKLDGILESICTTICKALLNFFLNEVTILVCSNVKQVTHVIDKRVLILTKICSIMCEQNNGAVISTQTAIFDAILLIIMLERLHIVYCFCSIQIYKIFSF